jgi:diguanylate cyclase (GGDEF)-like protein
MARLWTWLASFILPDGLLVLAAAGFLRPGGLPNVMLPLEQAFAYLVLAVGILLGLYVGHSRILFAMLLLALADRALLHLAAGAAASADVGRIMFNVVALLLPLNLLALSLITERSLLVSREFVRLILVLLQVFFVSWIGLPENVAFAAALESSFIDPRYTAWTPIAQPPLLAFGAALVLQTVRFTSYRNPLDRGFFWALVSVFLALHGTRAGWSPTNFLATAGLILIIAAYAEIYQSTYYDGLTGMRGRPYWDQALANLGSRFSIALIDIDGMKRVNEAHGYAVGDQILRIVARKITNLSGDGKAFRYDGNRFAVVFHDKSVADVLPHLEELRQAVAASPVTLPGRRRLFRKPDPPTQIPVTVSIGAAERDERRATPEQVMKAVEIALTRAKHDGRNQVKARAPVKE